MRVFRKGRIPGMMRIEGGGDDMGKVDFEAMH